MKKRDYKVACDFCGTTNPRYNELYKVALKDKDRVVYKCACLDCSGKLSEAPNYLAEMFLMYTELSEQREQEEIEKDLQEIYEKRKKAYITAMHNPQLEKVVYGTRYYEGDVELADPLSENTFQNERVAIATGEYTCVAWKMPIDVDLPGITEDSKIVDTIGIYLNGKVPAYEEMYYLGEKYLDSHYVGFFDVRDGSVLQHWVVENLINNFADVPLVSIHDDGFTAYIFRNTYSIYVAIENHEVVAVEIRFTDFVHRGQ